MERIAVVTAITAQKDDLIEYPSKDGATFIAYCDREFNSQVWEYRPAYNKFKSVRRNARIHKILIHQFVDTDYSLWIDGNIIMNYPASFIVEDWLKDADIALFEHPERDCIYDEAEVCKWANKEAGDNEEIQHQIEQYTLPKHYGLSETGVLLRRHNAVTENFNNYWWSEHCRHSTRDQLSFMHTVHKLGMKVNVIKPYNKREGPLGNRWGHPYFTYKLHTR